MKQWQRRMKLKPKAPFHIMWLGFRNEKEKHDWELSESIYRKETYWPDRLTPLTEEELKFKAECEANRPTKKEFDEWWDRKFGRTLKGGYPDPPVIMTEEHLKAIDRILDIKENK